MSESSFVFLLREPNSEFEIMYSQQEAGVVILAEAQIFVKGDHVDGGCLFFIDNLYDMDKLISYLSEIRGKMDRHYSSYYGSEAEGEVLGVSDSIGAKIELVSIKGARCKECNGVCRTDVELQNKLCFDCERKQIIKSADKFKPYNCMICKSPFSNESERDAGICGMCQSNAESGPAKNDFVCDQCGENFDTKKQLQSHQVKSCPNPSM